MGRGEPNQIEPRDVPPAGEDARSRHAVPAGHQFAGYALAIERLERTRPDAYGAGGVGARRHPVNDAHRHAVYAGAMARQQRLYDQLIRGKA